MTPVRVPARQRGAGLIELLIGLTLLGILAALAAPSLQQALIRQRVSSASAELAAALHWARWEALRSNAPVTLLRREDCGAALVDSGDWHCGWDLVAGVAPDIERLQRFDLPTGLRMVHSGGGDLAFNRAGQPARVAHRFVIGLPADPGTGVAPTPEAITLCMNRTGRVRAVHGQTSC